MQRRLLAFIAVGDQNRMPTVSHRRSQEFALEGALLKPGGPKFEAEDDLGVLYVLI